MNNRRAFLNRLSAISATLFAGRTVASAQQSDKPMTGMDHMNMQHSDKPPTAAQPNVPVKVAPGPFVPVTTLDVGDLPFTTDNGVKVFSLIAEPVKQVIVPGRTFDLWGFNGSAPGPTIQATEGDRVRIVFENRLPEPTGIHWHGLELPIEMDGVPGIGQKPVMPGERFTYEFPLHQNGTFFYHPHMAMQEMVGMLGGFIIHPKTPYAPHVDKDYLIALQEYAVLPNSSIPNSMNMEFNWLTFNGKAGPASTPLVVRVGERIRIRLINMGMDHHPIHIHGFTFWETGREAYRQPESAWTRGNTVLVGVAQARDIEFVANRPGDWMLHCHLPHHMMNQMSSNVGPMTRSPHFMPSGLSMENGMGMLTGEPGAPSGQEYGPSLGRGMGVGSNNSRTITNSPLALEPHVGHMSHDMQSMQGMSHETSMASDVAQNANQIPGFPQDAFMEGPMMAIQSIEKLSYNSGLPRGWSGFMQGMMTFVRVLPPQQYDEMMQKIQGGRL